MAGSGRVGALIELDAGFAEIKAFIDTLCRTTFRG
jgi:hypothetical protein